MMAQQLAAYIGWLLHKTKGGLVAGALFVLPDFITILGLSYLYVLLGHSPVIMGLFFGLKAAVMAVVIQAVVRVGSRALKNNVLRGIATAATAFVAIFFFDAPFSVIVLTAALIGYIGGRMNLPAFKSGGHRGPSGGDLVHDRDTALGEGPPDHARPNLGWSLKISSALLFLWLAPVGVLLALFGPDDVYTRIATCFSQMAVVTFGGAYAVLAYVGQEAVGTFGWLQPGEMLDGLGLPESTPGPLIMVTQFVGFLAAFREAGGLHPPVAATLGAILTTCVTFVPCFLWIFAGAPFVERLRGNRALSASLGAITAAVVGVILNLALWFAIHALFLQVRVATIDPVAFDLPVLSSLHLPALLVAVGAAIAVFRFKVGMIPTLLATSAAGIAFYIFEPFFRP